MIATVSDRTLVLLRQKCYPFYGDTLHYDKPNTYTRLYQVAITFSMTALYQDLQTLGLSPNQATVYLALARSGPSRAGEIIRRTGMHRNLVYLALQELIEKNLVASSKVKGVAVFKTLSFARLLEGPRDKERLAKRLAEDMGSIAHRATLKQEIVVHEGIDELRQFLTRTYEVASVQSVIRYLGFSPHWHEIIDAGAESILVGLQRDKQIRMKALAASVSARQKKYVNHTQGLLEMRISSLVSDETNEIEILDDRISIRLFTPPYFVVEIVNKELAKNYQNYFDSLWRMTKR